MSQQYRRFKQNFLKQHPKNIVESVNSSRHYSPKKVKLDEDLKIQNQNYFPFQQVQNRTFGQLPQESFHNYKANMKMGLNINQNQKGKYNYNYDYVNQNKDKNNDQKYVIQAESKYQYHSKYEEVNNDKYLTNKQLNSKSIYQRKNQPFQEINHEIQYKKSTKYPSAESKYIPVNTNNNQFNISNSSNQYLKLPQTNYIPVDNQKIPVVKISPPKQQPIVYSNPIVQNTVRSVSPSAYNPSHSRVVVQPIVNYQVQNLPQSRVVVSNIPHVQQIPINGQINFNLPSSPRVNNKQIPIQNKVIIHEQQPMISKRQYESLRNECIMWQQKYYQTNDQLIRVQQYQNQGFVNQLNQVREQNRRLNEQLRSFESFDQNKLKQSYSLLLNKYQDTLMKECMLLVDRFRLEMKQNQRF